MTVPVWVRAEFPRRVSRRTAWALLGVLAGCTAQTTIPESQPRVPETAYIRDCPYEQCADEYYGDQPRPGVYRGTYELGFEHSSFDDGSKCRYWLSGNLGPLTDMVNARCGDAYCWLVAKIEVEGILSPPGCYGHMGTFRRELKATRLVSFSVIALKETKPR